MYKSETSGVSQYQQVMSQTPGMAPSSWFEGTSPQQLVLVEFIQPKMEKKDEESLKSKTA